MTATGHYNAVWLLCSEMSLEVNVRYQLQLISNLVTTTVSRTEGNPYLLLSYEHLFIDLSAT
jgi:hypothetical protein